MHKQNVIKIHSLFLKIEILTSIKGYNLKSSEKFHVLVTLLHIEVRLFVLLCAVNTVEGNFRFSWMISPNVGQTHKENPNLVRFFYMTFTLNDIYKQYNKLHEH